jgi:hypothetical protein
MIMNVEGNLDQDIIGRLKDEKKQSENFSC